MGRTAPYVAFSILSAGIRPTGLKCTPLAIMFCVSPAALANRSLESPFFFKNSPSFISIFGFELMEQVCIIYTCVKKINGYFMWHQMSKGKNKIWVNPQMLMLVKDCDGPNMPPYEFASLKDLKTFLLYLQNKGFAP